MPLPLVGLALGAAGLGSAILGSRSASKAQKAQQAALDFEKQKWNAGQVFRDKGTALLNQEVDPEALSGIFADEGNPYAAGMTYRNPMRPTGQPATAPRTAQPRTPSPNLMLGGTEGAEAAAPTFGDPQTEALETRRAQLAAMAQMLPQRSQMAARRMR